MRVKNDSTLVFNKYRAIFDPPLDGAGLIEKKYIFSPGLSQARSKLADLVGF